jgi:hypothetical protein
MDFQDAEPMPEEYLPEYFAVRDRYLSELNKVGQPIENAK